MNENLKIALDELGVDFINELTNQLLAADKKATGQLISSLNYKVVDVLDNLLLTISAEPYLKFIDEGRKPGKMPPSQVFFKWIDARGIVFKNNKGKIIKKETNLNFFFYPILGSRCENSVQSHHSGTQWVAVKDNDF